MTDQSRPDSPLPDSSFPEEDTPESSGGKDSAPEESGLTDAPATSPGIESVPPDQDDIPPVTSSSRMDHDSDTDTKGPRLQEDGTPDEPSPEQDENPSIQEAEHEEPHEVILAQEPPRESLPTPVVSVSAGPEQGLSGFLDTLDERAKDWWEKRKARKAAEAQQKKEERARQTSTEQQAVAAEQPIPAERSVSADESTSSGRSDPTELSDAESRPEDTPQAAAVLGEAAPSATNPPQPGSHDAVTPALAASAIAGRLALPKPPPVDRRPPGQLHTGVIPTLESAAVDSRATSHQNSPVVVHHPDTQPTALDGPDDDQSSGILPYYNGDTRQPATSLSSTPSAPTRVHRAFDDQRQRDVIMQKASAIEAATAENYRPQRFEFADDEEDLYTYIPPYNLPSRHPDPEPTVWDLARQLYVSLGALTSLSTGLWMLGFFGTEPAALSENGLREHSEGWFSGEHALLSPDHNMYWLWPVIAAGLALHALYQWTGSQRSTARQRRSGWLVGTASLLMLPVVAALHHGLFTIGALATLAVALTLLDAIRQFNLHTARTTGERRLTDAIVGLFFGFAMVQAMSFGSVWLTVHGWDIPGIPPLLWAAVGLFICVWTAAFYSMTERGRITIALGLGWGMFWLIFPRLLAEVTSVWVAIGAAMGAFIVILCTQSRRHRINHAERRAAMGRPLEDII